MAAPEAPTARALAGYGAGSRIRAALPQLPQAMAKIGTLLLDDPSLPLRLSITELAERAGTSPASPPVDHQGTRSGRHVARDGHPVLPRDRLHWLPSPPRSCRGFSRRV